MKDFADLLSASESKLFRLPSYFMLTSLHGFSFDENIYKKLGWKVKKVPSRVPFHCSSCDNEQVAKFGSAVKTQRYSQRRHRSLEVPRLTDSTVKEIIHSYTYLV